MRRPAHVVADGAHCCLRDWTRLFAGNCDGLACGRGELLAAAFIDGFRLGRGLFRNPPKPPSRVSVAASVSACRSTGVVLPDAASVCVSVAVSVVASGRRGFFASLAAGGRFATRFCAGRAPYVLGGCLLQLRYPLRLGLGRPDRHVVDHLRRVIAGDAGTRRRARAGSRGNECNGRHSWDGSGHVRLRG